MPRVARFIVFTLGNPAWRVKFVGLLKSWLDFARCENYEPSLGGGSAEFNRAFKLRKVVFKTWGCVVNSRLYQIISPATPI